MADAKVLTSASDSVIFTPLESKTQGARSTETGTSNGVYIKFPRYFIFFYIRSNFESSFGHTAVRPLAGTSVENKLTVILPPDQVDFLGRLSLDIRSKTRAKVRRTEIIRALIAGLMGSGMDLSGFGTEEDIADVVKERLKG